MEIERGLGFEPTDREFEQLGYDIESRVPGTGKLRFIEVKGRITGAETVTVTRTRYSTRSTSRMITCWRSWSSMVIPIESTTCAAPSNASRTSG